MNTEEIKNLIEVGLPESEVTVEGDGNHFVVKVVSDSFEGLPVLKQHKLVYSTLGERVGGRDTCFIDSDLYERQLGKS